jgi:organic hydroperoxide reductase OsmC/OhrA
MDIDLDPRGADDVSTTVILDGDLPDAGGQRPEMLLTAAIASSYAVTLRDSLSAVALPRTDVSVSARGALTLVSGRIRLTRVVVEPAIRGADAARPEAYQRAAVAARDDCLIGRAIRGNVAYVVGEVTFPNG